MGYARTWDGTTGEGALVQGQLAFVHPDHRRRGVGGALLQWLEVRQREIARGHPDATAWLHQATVTEGERDRAHLLRRAGYQVVRHFLDMERPTLDDMQESALGVHGESALSAARLYEDCGIVVAKCNAMYRKPVELGPPD